MPPDEDDPVVASYDVYIRNPSQTLDTTSTTADTTTKQESNPKPAGPKLYILQYPAHRPSTKPYSSARSQRPTSLRIKPQTGIFEVDVPILTTDNYNAPQATHFGRAMHESQAAHPLPSHGLSGGFAQNHTSSLPPHQNGNHHDDDYSLQTQTLGCKISHSTDKDPVYMLAHLTPGTGTTSQIHLRHLDGLIQLRPQLHHIDAQDEQKRRAETSTKQSLKPENVNTAVEGGGKAKLETKAIEMKLKDQTKEDAKDRNLNLNARLLRDIQNEPWRRYDWVERNDEDYSSNPVLISTSTTMTDAGEVAHAQLRSALDNDEWLNRMSSPGIELRTRLKGRDRERARRKRQERLRLAKAAGFSGAGVIGEESSGSEDDDGDIGTNAGVEVDVPSSPEVQVKQEAAVPPAIVREVATPSAAAPRKRGRPPKDKPAET